MLPRLKGGENNNMNVCKICGKRIIRNDYFERHMAETHPQPEAPATPVAPVPVPPPPPPVPVNPVAWKNEIVLNFKKPVEIMINGHPYNGQTIICKDFQIASEIVRIAKAAYGIDILV